VTRSRLLACLLALSLAAPSAAFAQGAGDDQYQDPFGDEPTQSDGGAGGGGGLSDTPPGGGTTGSGGDSTGSTGGGTTTTAPEATATTTPSDQLPNTGSDPRILALFGGAILLAGVGLRLRTIDPNDY
jgi:LPXTG-motif cell wall-anchored protein